MKNLRRSLRFLLCSAMLLGVMLMSANAAYYEDEEEITHIKAVTILTDLKIIEGVDDGGRFDPGENATRAELCKMIFVALNGGKESQYVNTACSYPDASDHWAAGYIEYCSDLGIVAGRGDGNFDPDGTVTGIEAAKMLLVAIGYDAAIEGFTGSGWETAVRVRADEKNLYQELDSFDASAGLSRDHAAQMVYNAFNAVMVEYEYSTVTNADGELQSLPFLKDNDAGETIFFQKFNVIIP